MGQACQALSGCGSFCTQHQLAWGVPAWAAWSWQLTLWPGCCLLLRCCSSLGAQTANATHALPVSLRDPAGAQAVLP
jgi:hypothetical protein